MKKAFLPILAITILTFFFFPSCQKSEKVTVGQKKLKVVTTLFPLYDFARHIGREKVEVNSLLPPGVESHAFEPRPADIKRIQDSDIFLFTNKFMEPWVGGLLKGIDTRSLTIVDTSKGITLLQRTSNRGDEEHAHADESGSPDPHIWLDLANAIKMVETIATEFIAKDPQNKDFYTKNSYEYNKRLEELDKKYKNTLSRCRKTVIIHAGHFAFGYLEDPLPLDRDAQHLQALVGRRDGIAFVGRPGGRYERNPSDPQFLGDVAGNDQVPVVDRVERPAEEHFLFHTGLHSFISTSRHIITGRSD